MRNVSGSIPTNEMNSVAEQNDTSHELVDDVLDQRSITSKIAVGQTNVNQAGATITISTVVHSSPNREDLVRGLKRD